MSKLIIKKGTTSKLVQIFVQDTSKVNGSGLTGLVYNSAGLVFYYYRSGAAGSVQVPLSNATVGAWTSGGFKEIDATGLPGIYEIGLPNAALISGASTVIFDIFGATNMAPVPLEIQLTNLDYDDNNFGLTNLDVAVSTRSTFAGGAVSSVTGNIGGDITGKVLGGGASSFTAVGVQADLEQWRGTTPDVLSSGKVTADVRLWVTGTPATLTTNGFMKSAVLRWLTDDAAGTPSALNNGLIQVDVERWLNSVVTAATSGIPDVNTKNINNFTATTDVNNLLKVDVEDWKAQVILTPNVTGVPKVDVIDWLGSAPNSLIAGRVDTLTQLHSGATQAGSGSTTIILDGSASSTDSFYDDCIVWNITTGQARLISGYMGSTNMATVTPAWQTTPGTGDTFVIIPSGYVDLGLWLGTTPDTLSSGKVPTDLKLWLGSAPSVLHSGLVQVDVQQWLNGIIPAPNVTGIPKVDLVDWNGITLTTTAPPQGSDYTSMRAGFLDNLNIGGPVASSSEVTSIQNSTSVVRVVPEFIERPPSGTTTFRIEVFVYNILGNNIDADTNPTVDLVNQTGTSRNFRLDSTTMAHISLGRYRTIYTSTSTDALEQLIWTFTVDRSSIVDLFGNTSLVTDTITVNFTSSDRSDLQAIFNKLPSKPYLTGTSNVTGAAEADFFTGNFSGSVGSVAGNVSGSISGNITGKVLGGGASSFTGVGVQADLEQWRGTMPDTLSSGKVTADVRLWQMGAPAGLTDNGFLKVKVVRWLTDDTAGTPASLTENGFLKVKVVRWLTDDAAGTPNALNNGLIQTDVERWLNGIIPTPNVTGIPKVDLVDWKGITPNSLINGRVDSDTIVPDNAGIAAIKVQTDKFLFDGSNRVKSTPQTDETGVTTLLTRIPGTIQPQTGDAFARLGVPVGGSISLDIAEVEADVDVIMTNTASLSTDLATDTTNIRNDIATLSSSVVSNVASVLARIGSFTGTGINTVLGFFQALIRKDAAVPSDLGSATYAPINDSLEAIGLHAIHIPEGIQRNTAYPNFKFVIRSTADHISGAVGASVTAQRSIDNLPFFPCSNPVVEIGNGAYSIDLSAGDLNGVSVMLFFSSNSGDPVWVTLKTS